MNNKRIYILKEYIIKEIKSLIKEEDSILITRRSPEEREKNHIIATQRKIQQYIKDGSKGTLDLSNTPITLLPDNLTKVGGDLELFNTPIASLPDNLKVRGSLSLMNTKITSLPNNLTIKGGLYLDNTPITSLPDNLTVGDDLSLMNTPITSLPNNLTVGGDLELFNTPLSAKYTKEQLKQMLPRVKGEIYL